MGGGGGHSKSKNKASFSEDVWGGQAPALQQLYQDASNLFSGMNYDQLNQLAQTVQGGMQQAYGQMQPGWGNQLGGGFRDAGLERSLQESMRSPSSMGQMYQQIVGGQGNTYANPLIDSMRNQMLDTTSRQIGTNNDLRAATLGQSGSARHGVQNALTQRYNNQDFQNAANQINYDTYDKDLNWKMAIAEQADLGRGQAQERMMNYLGGQNAAQQGGLNFGQNMQNLGMGLMAPQTYAMNMPWQYLSQYGGIIGPPQVLGRGSGSGNAFGMQGGGGMFG